MKYALYWLPMPLIAIFNGALREAGYKTALGDLAAHQLSTLLLILLLFVYGYLIRSRLPLATQGDALTGGLLWMLMTIGFEFGMGLFTGVPMSELLANYNLAEGRVWIAIPLFMWALPSLLRRFNR